MVKRLLIRLSLLELAFLAFIQRILTSWYVAADDRCERRIGPLVLSETGVRRGEP